MQQLNSVHLRGIVGYARTYEHLGVRLCRLNLATSVVYRLPDGDCICDTIWTDVELHGGKGMPDLDAIAKDTRLEVKGHLKNSRYTDRNGVERTEFGVVAHEAMILPQDEPMTFEIREDK